MRTHLARRPVFELSICLGYLIDVIMISYSMYRVTFVKRTFILGKNTRSMREDLCMTLKIVTFVLIDCLIKAIMAGL